MNNYENKEPVRVEICEASPEDVYEISDVQKETWLATYPNEQYGITREDLETEDFHSTERMEKRREVMNNPDSNKKFWVAKSDGRVIGYCCGERNDEYNKVRSICIIPGFQGQGTGKKLMEHMFQFFDMSLPTKLNVAVYNTNAISFYKKLGFVEGVRFEKNPEGAFPSGREIPEMEMILEPKKN